MSLNRTTPQMELVARCRDAVFNVTPVTLNPEVRYCETEGCKNKLSGYNTGTRCWVCGQEDEA